MDDDRLRRIRDLEETQKEIQKQLQSMKTDMELMKRDMSSIADDIAKIRAPFVFMFRILGGAALTAFAAWIISGGMSNVGK